MNRLYGLGLTLLEAIITMAIVAVVIGLALPDVSSLRAQRATLLANHLVAAVHAARAQALVYHAALTICPSQDGFQCVTDWDARHLLVLMPMINQAVAQVLYDITMPKMPGTLTWHGFGAGPYPQLNPSGDSFQHNGT